MKAILLASALCLACTGAALAQGGGNQAGPQTGGGTYGTGGGTAGTGPTNSLGSSGTTSGMSSTTPGGHQAGTDPGTNTVPPRSATTAPAASSAPAR